MGPETFFKQKIFYRDVIQIFFSQGRKSKLAQITGMIIIFKPKKFDSSKAPRFNGDPEEFSWWKTKMYSHIMSLDEELWDVLEDGVGDLVLDEE